MPITPGEDIEASDFINESERDATPANDAGRVPKLESNGRLSNRFIDLGVTQGTSSPMALTTDGLGRVLVIASFEVRDLNGTGTLTLAYDGVTKHQVTIDTSGQNGVHFPATLMFSEVLPDQTANITVATSSGSIENLQIIAITI